MLLRESTPSYSEGPGLLPSHTCSESGSMPGMPRHALVGVSGSRTFRFSTLTSG
jgi:hypothetical protein